LFGGIPPTTGFSVSQKVGDSVPYLPRIQSASGQALPYSTFLIHSYHLTLIADKHLTNSHFTLRPTSRSAYQKEKDQQISYSSMTQIIGFEIFKS
jgi:hypothetical protein